MVLSPKSSPNFRTSFRGDLVFETCYDYLPSTDARRADASFRKRKCTIYLLFELSKLFNVKAHFVLPINRLKYFIQFNDQNGIAAAV